MVNDKKHSTKGKADDKSIGGWLWRLVLTVVILAIVSFFTPGFSITGMWYYLIAALVISVLDYLAEAFMGIDASPFGRGIKGFFIAAVILYMSQYIVPNMSVSIIGALLAAVAIGILDAIIPGRVM